MNFDVRTIPEFERQFKRLAKKYSSIKQDLQRLVNELRIDPRQGTSLGKGCYKVRMKIGSKGQGRSGGARVITYVVVLERKVYLLFIYDKAKMDSISAKEIRGLLDSVPD